MHKLLLKNLYYNKSNFIMINYVIIKLSESKTTKAAFTNYITTEGGGGL